ncbi:hypothetical protein ACIHBQ_04945 [Streptomyces sp. NPDC052492]|uniref:hypothetical protein n=1 Tax=Streptomyces sp. NPDC052492 TaxID=3365691 RepID=UPI0037D7CD36
MTVPDPLTARAWALLALAAEHRAADVEPLLGDLSRDDLGTLAYGVAHLAVHGPAAPMNPEGIRRLLLTLAAEQDHEGGTDAEPR